jgi:hypothetical protein
MLTREWQKAPCTQSGCLEARLSERGCVELHSTVNGHRMSLLSTEWADFLAAAKTGAFDLPVTP